MITTLDRVFFSPEELLKRKKMWYNIGDIFLPYREVYRKIPEERHGWIMKKKIFTRY